MKNPYMKESIKTFYTSLTLFERSLTMASTKDDGVTDKQEQKLIKKITSDTEKLKRTLREAMGDYPHTFA